MDQKIKNKKKIVLGCLAGLCVIVISGCQLGQNGTKNPTTESTTETSSQITPVPTLTSTPTPTPESSATPTPTPTPTPTLTPTPTPTPSPTPTPTPTSTPTPIPSPTPTPNLEEEAYSGYSNKKLAWWFKRNKEHKPAGSGEEFDISKYGGYYLDKNVEEGDKVIYLTFDCGYELGYTNSILDSLAKHKAKAIFFVTRSFIKSNPELVIRMKKEGHMVGNHTTTHPSMPDKSISSLIKEMEQCADMMLEKTGYKIDPYMRPPMGEYSERTLKLMQDMGYKSIFWSIAYYDYDTENQPGKDYVVDHFATNHHNGAIPLIHNTSESNMQALDDVLTLLEKEGYRFGTLDELK